MKYLDKTPVPVDGPCVNRRYDDIFCRYYCSLTLETLPEECCICPYQKIRYVRYE